MEFYFRQPIISSELSPNIPSEHNSKRFATNGFVVLSACQNMWCEMFITFQNMKGSLMSATLTI
jgi:hypothetical protein